MRITILLLLTCLLPQTHAAADSSCTQRCYVENSRCDRDSGSGCSSTLQRCLQTCGR